MPKLSRAGLAGVFLLSLSLIGLEVLLVRLFSIIQTSSVAAIVIALALLGFGYSGTLIALIQKRLTPEAFPIWFVSNAVAMGVFSVASFYLCAGLGFEPSQLLWDGSEAWTLGLYFLILSLPFFFGANGIGLALALYRNRSDEVYAADLIGAGCGALLVCLAMFLLPPLQCLWLVAGLSVLAGLPLLVARDMNSTHASIIVIAILGLAAYLPSQDLPYSDYKDIAKAHHLPETEVIATFHSPAASVTAMASPKVPWRHAPGLDVFFGGELPPQLGIFRDGGDFTTIDLEIPVEGETSYHLHLPAALPYNLADPLTARVLQTPLGGGRNLLTARAHGFNDVTICEPNSALLALWHDPRVDAGHILDTVHLKPRELRVCLADEEHRFDVIHIGLDPLGLPGPLFTQEALRSYEQALNPGGILAIELWVQAPERLLLRILATLAQTFPDQKPMVLQSLQTQVVVIKKTALTREERLRLERFIADNHFDLLPPRTIDQGALASYPFDISPTTDDRPYSMHFATLATTLSQITSQNRTERGLVDVGYLLLWCALGLGSLLGIALIILPLLALRQNASPKAGTVSRLRFAGYFVTLGLAFMVTEISYILKLRWLLGDETYAVALVIGCFLVFAGLGAYATRWITQLWKPFVAIMGLGSATALALAMGTDAALAMPLGLKIVLSVLALAPLAFAMGMPFVLGLRTFIPASLPASDAQGAARVAWAWGINGCASVVATLLAHILNLHIGFIAAALVGVVLYGLCSLALYGTRGAQSGADERN